MFQRIRTKFKSRHLDDVAFRDTWQTALKNLIDLESRAKEVGPVEPEEVYLLNQKCEVTASGPNIQAHYHECQEVFPKIDCVPVGKTTLLGAGLSVRSELKSKLDHVKVFISRTRHLPCQTAFFRVKN